VEIAEVFFYAVDGDMASLHRAAPFRSL